MAAKLKSKHPCCHSEPRCKRCPVVLRRLEKAGSLRRKGKRSYVVVAVTKKQLRAARVR